VSMCVLCGSPAWPSPPVVGPLLGPSLYVGPLWAGSSPAVSTFSVASVPRLASCSRSFSLSLYPHSSLKRALELLVNRYGSIRFAQVPERVSTQSFVVLIIGNLKSNHLGAEGTFKSIDV